MFQVSVIRRGPTPIVPEYVWGVAGIPASPAPGLIAVPVDKGYAESRPLEQLLSRGGQNLISFAVNQLVFHAVPPRDNRCLVMRCRVGFNNAKVVPFVLCLSQAVTK